MKISDCHQFNKKMLYSKEKVSTPYSLIASVTAIG